MRFGFVTDELSWNPREAIDIALDWGVHEFEVRNVYEQRFPRLSFAVLDELVSLHDEYDIRFTAVSPGFFKCHLSDRIHLDYAFGEGLEVSMDFMDACMVPLLICFGFEMETGTDDEAVARLGAIADRLADRGFEAAVENETHCKFDTPERVALLLERANRPNLGANWDLANLKAGAPAGFPEGYERVKPHIRNVHAKDVALLANGNTEWKPIGEGVCDWKGQMDALLRDQIVEHVTIENHCGPLIDVGLHNLRALQDLAGV